MSSLPRAVLDSTVGETQTRDLSITSLTPQLDYQASLSKLGKNKRTQLLPHDEISTPVSRPIIQISMIGCRNFCQACSYLPDDWLKITYYISKKQKTMSDNDKSHSTGTAESRNKMAEKTSLQTTVSKLRKQMMQTWRGSSFQIKRATGKTQSWTVKNCVAR